MKNSFIKKILITTLISISTLSSMSIGASAEWRQDSNGWWYSQGDDYIKNQWKQIDNKWYYFNNNGYMLTNTNIGGYQVDNNGVWIQNTSTNTTNTSNSNNVTNIVNNINNGTIINGNINIGNTTNNTSIIQQTYNTTTNNNTTNTKKTDLFPCWTIIDGKYYHIDKDENIDYDTTVDGYKIGDDGAWVQDNSINPPNVVELPYGYKLQARQVIQKLQYEAKNNQIKEEIKLEKHNYRLQKIQELKDKIADIDKHNYKNGEELKQKYENEIKEIELEDKNDYETSEENKNV